MLDLFARPTFQVGLDLATSISLIFSAIYIAFQLNRQSRRQQEERLERESAAQAQTIYWQRQQTYFTNYFEAVREETHLLQRIIEAMVALSLAQNTPGIAEEARERAKTESAERATAYSDFLRRYISELVTYGDADYLLRLERLLELWDSTLEAATAGEVPGGHIPRAAYEIHIEIAATARTIYAGGSRDEAQNFARDRSATIYAEDGSTETTMWLDFRNATLAAYDEAFAAKTLTPAMRVFRPKGRAY